MSTGMIWETSSTSSAETERLGGLLGKQLKGGEVIELISDLGGGKTTFTKGLARGAGSQQVVTSPTFTLDRIYQAPNFDIHHFDFYRLSDPGIMADELAEFINDDKTVVVVEWAGVVKNILPAQRISIKLQPAAASPDERRITISYPASWKPVIMQVETEWGRAEP